MAEQRRVYKIAEQIRSVIATEMYNLADPRFTLVTITSVVVNADLKHAKIYWSVLQSEFKQKEIEEAFKSAAGILRRVLAKKLLIRHIPAIRFYYDNTAETSIEVQRLLEGIKGGREEEE